MKKSIKRRLAWSYLLLIIFTVVLFETIILSALMMYYKEGVKQTLRDQSAMFSSFYEQELIEGRYKSEASQLLSQYNFHINAHVQLVDMKGNILAESHKTAVKNISQEDDVQNGLDGGMTTSIRRVDGEKVMSLTYPLKSGGEMIGAIRFTTSLVPVHTVFTENALILLAIGGVVIVLAAFISFFLAGSLIRPIGQMISAAEQMASGKFSARVPKGKNDELGRLADTLNYMASQVQKHEKLKNEFIASVSHDLRTPLTSVNGWAITLHSMAKDDLFREGLDIIKTESERLSHLLGDLLDFSSLSSGRISFTFEEVDLADTIQQVVQQLQPRAQRQSVQLTTIVREPIIGIKADKNRLIQVFINLLDNALKFTPVDGSITMSVERIENRAIVKVSDTGVGIPAHQLDTIKDKFAKGKAKGSGTGLGLAICEEIIEGHGGSLELRSSAEEGTIAEVTLPVTEL
ncbi:MAG TPA: sensor histidine kinase [Bacillus bacterium]|uniref:histidine kinase n=1 Tax=Siminovitchia fordii TaxID=254759 RepID=A0ABQ4K6T0_9BACI|nr:HAMP domain-containing sensor histidine kinase [Siminovitchia fordii]GIN20720.1 two-component sensor histidine kinase [Siminovitchia fordii]HBZ08728.1 sensor histidine kinase [Bacillus sp. (in: firmicutes)]